MQVLDHLQDPLNEACLANVLGNRPFRYYQSVSSTNDVAWDWQLADPTLPSGSVVVADQQTGGRGRSGRLWHTPPGQAIAMSIILTPEIDPANLHRITMLAGIALIETIAPTISKQRQTLALKWPNDLMINAHKLSGILTEAVWLGNELQAVIVGIGINIRVDFNNRDLAHIATNLEDYTERPVSRAELIAAILERIDEWKTRLHLPLLRETYITWLGTLGKTVTYRTVHGMIQGRALDVDPEGALLVQDDAGQMHRIMVGDISVG